MRAICSKRWSCDRGRRLNTRRHSPHGECRLVCCPRQRDRLGGPSPPASLPFRPVENSVQPQNRLQDPRKVGQSRYVASEITGVGRIVDPEDPMCVIPPYTPMRIGFSAAFAVVKSIEYLHRTNAQQEIFVVCHDVYFKIGFLHKIRVSERTANRTTKNYHSFFAFRQTAPPSYGRRGRFGSESSARTAECRSPPHGAKTKRRAGCRHASKRSPLPGTKRSRSGRSIRTASFIRLLPEAISATEGLSDTREATSYCAARSCG